MTTRIDRQDSADPMLSAAEGDAGLDAWTLEELDDELGALPAAFAASDDAGG